MIQVQSQRKPHVFIASTGAAAQEGGVAPKLKRLLGEAVQADVWNEHMILNDADGKPRHRGEVMANLYKAARYYDFVIILLGAEAFEAPAAGNADQRLPNPNLLLEMGLFMGALGNRRTLVVLQPGLARTDVRWPSDLDGHAFGNEMVELASSDEATLKRQADQILATIHQADATAGLSLLPSTGTAISYFKNFIQPVAEYLLEDTFMVDGVAHRAGETSYTFDIVMPLALEGAGFKQRAKFYEVNKDQLEERKVVFPNGRTYPFFVRRDGARDHIHLVDFATPLASSADAIDLIIDDEMKSLTAIDYTQADQTPAQMLEQKEIANFELTLFKLLRLQQTAGQTPVSREFPNRIRLRRQDLNQPLSWA